MSMSTLKPTKLASAQSFADPSDSNSELVAAYLSTRKYSEQMCQPLETEDYGLQAMESTSPAKWHLAHTSWFFETFILKPYCAGYPIFHPDFEYLFNSYYNAVGNQYPRHQRGLLSRPTVADVYRYRQHVDDALCRFLEDLPAQYESDVVARLRLGCHHEQQHQELFYTDLKYCWLQNPIYPAYRNDPIPASATSPPLAWQSYEGQVRQIGYSGEGGFCFDNELPRHPQYVAGFSMADRLVSNGEFLEFIADDGYQRPELWLADGWAALSASPTAGNRPVAPLYWLERDGQWLEYTLHGLVALDPNRPACHLSAYEADAFARWKNCRLPTEFEWEVSASGQVFDERDKALEQPPSQRTPLHPLFDGKGPYNKLWQWTSSAYAPYPGFRTADGAIGEYNGKFMVNQLVLKGGSVATSPGHYRHSYRNFFYPGDQWQFTGLRLARDL